MVLRIAPVAIIDRQLPFEYTITSRSTDVVVMAHPVQNINHSAFRSMFEREKLSENNFNDWFHQLKLVLRVKKKMYVVEQPLPATPAADFASNVLAESAAGEEGKPVAAYVIQMKGYVDQLERLGYMLPQDIIVGLILNGLTKDFAGSVRNYDMHNMRKTIGELHAMLIEYEKAKGKGKANGKGKDKQAYIPKPKNPKPSAKEHPAKDDVCHHCKEVGYRKRNCLVYLAELLKKKKQVGSASSLCILPIELFAFPNKSWVYDTGCVRVQVEAIGSFELVFPNGLVICLDNCHYAPSILRGVVSVHRLVENGFVHRFTNFGILVSKNNVHYFNAIPNNGIYEIDMHNLVLNVNSIYNVSIKRAKHNLDSTYLWHYHLAHINKKRIEKLQHEGLLKSIDDESFDQYVSCLSGKMTRKSFPHRPERAFDLLRIIHTDVCGPLRHVSKQGANYFITSTDDYSRYDYVYLLKHKHDVFETLKLTPPYTPQHNDVSERRNHTLLDMVRSMMNLTTLLLSFWDYALESATHILNMVPTKKGCEALMKRDTPDKLQQRSVKCIFIGYPKVTMGYYFYFPPENKIVVARYAEFFEKNLITQKVSRRAMDLEEIQDEDTSPFEITSEIPMEVKGFKPPQEEDIPIRRSERTRRAPDRLCLNVEVEEHSIGDLNEPTSYKAAMLDSESNKWIDAINAEIQSMMNNMVWVMVDLPPGCKTVGSKWIFKKKTDMDGFVHTYKARFVAKGYTQLYGVDYEETFSRVTNIRAIRILISIAAYYDYEIWQMDIRTSFLNGYQDEDQGCQDRDHMGSFLSLQDRDRKIGSRSFKDPFMVLRKHQEAGIKDLMKKIKRFGFTQNLNEPCVYQKASGSNVTFLILYVDDIIIMGNHILSLQSVKDYLGSCFAMKDLGEVAFILGIKIYRDRSKRLIGLGQNAYMEKILKRYKMDNYKCGHIPMQERLGLNQTQGASTPKEVKRMQNVPFVSVVGSIVYAVKCTRPDVAFTKIITSQFQQNPAALHFANKPRVQRGARHYHRRYHYVRECIALGEIRFLEVHTDDNLADSFTKTLPNTKLTQHANSMGLRLASSFM
ncbi:retrotransposon protein, putative, ty1-copia subclass [Tanacetum coccineum]